MPIPVVSGSQGVSLSVAICEVSSKEGFVRNQLGFVSSLSVEITFAFVESVAVGFSLVFDPQQRLVRDGDRRKWGS